MGIWGVRLYQNDVALDTKEEYIQLLRGGNSDEEALKKVVDKNKEIINDEIDGPVFWLALAETMWKMGRLTEEVKQKALKVIEDGEDIKNWKELAEFPEQIKTRQNELNRIKEKLNKEMPKARKLKKEVGFNCGWKNGDVYAYQITEKDTKHKEFIGRYLLFRKIGETQYQNCILPIVYTYITKVSYLPDEEKKIEEMGIIIHRNFGNVLADYELELQYTSKQAMHKNLIYLGNFENLEKPNNEYFEVMKQQQNYYNSLWTKYTYEIIDDFIKYGTNLDMKEIQYTSLKTIENSVVRMFSKLKEYKKILGITREKTERIIDDDLAFIAMQDGLADGGVVTTYIEGLRPTRENKKEASKRIDKIEQMIKDGDYKNKEEKIEYLEKVRNKVLNHDEAREWEKAFERYYGKKK